MRPPFTLLALVLLTASTVCADPLRLHGAPVLAAPMAAAAGPLRDLGIDIKVDKEGNTTSAVAAVGTRQADIAMLTRRVSAAERADYPEMQFYETQVGVQVLAIIVSREMWASGVRAITKEQLIDIYEGRLVNWKELGGEDRELKFFNPERGRGTWEFFAFWLYGDISKAPLGKKFETVVDGEDARNTVEFNAGAMCVAAPRWADGRGSYALAIKDRDGTVASPVPADVASKRYPFARPAILVTNNRPTGEKKQLLEFMLGDIGQSLLKKNDLVPMSDLPTTDPDAAAPRLSQGKAGKSPFSFDFDSKGASILTVLVALIGFWLWMLADCVSNERRPAPKLLWMVALLIASIVAAPFYFLFCKLPRKSKRSHA